MQQLSRHHLFLVEHAQRLELSRDEDSAILSNKLPSCVPGMKSRIIIYGALLLVGSAWIAILANGRFASWLLEKQPPTLDRPAVFRTTGGAGTTWARGRETPWTDTKVILYRESGAVVQLDAKSTVYHVVSTKASTNAHKPFDVPVIAFVDPASGKAWADWSATGEVDTIEYENEDGTAATNYLIHTNLFFETEAGIFNGYNTIDDGAFSWGESTAGRLPPGEGVAAVIDRFETNADSAWPYNHGFGQSFFGPYFRPDFFASHNMGSQTVPIQRIEVGHGTLRLSIDSLKYPATASVWLDLKTFEVRRAVEFRPVRRDAETLWLGALPAFMAILTAIATLAPARTARRPAHIIMSTAVLLCTAWSLLLLYRIHLQGAWPTHLPLFRPVIVLGDWAVYLPVAGIVVAMLITAGQALFLQSDIRSQKIRVNSR